MGYFLDGTSGMVQKFDFIEKGMLRMDDFLRNYVFSVINYKYSQMLLIFLVEVSNLIEGAWKGSELSLGFYYGLELRFLKY